MVYACMGAGVLSLPLTSEEGVCGCALCLQRCAHPLHRSEGKIERKRGKERDKERERERRREKEGKRMR